MFTRFSLWTIPLTLLFIFIMALLLPGCTQPKKDHIPPINDNGGAAPQLPKNATNIKDMGNGWLTFQCEIEGRKRTFLFARYVVHGGPIGAITELSDPAPIVIQVEK
jgi:hypothetical protein